jgi:Ca2+:H+ antiporter
MNLTLVLGLVFLVAGVQFHKRKFNRYQATYNLGMLSVASLALAVPTGLAVFDQWSTTQERLEISRWVAALLMAMYFQWLAFHLCTHNTMFDKKAAKKDSKEAHFFWATTQIGKQNSEYEMMAAQQKERGFAQLSARKDEDDEDEVEDDDDDEDEEGINLCCATTMLLGATVIVAFHCDFLVDALVPTCQEYGVKLAFVATVIFPMVGNFSEVIAAVSIARKGKLDLAMGVAIGSATQIALFVIPVAVFIAWFFEKPLDLDFEFFQVKIVTIALLVVTLLILDGEANWLKGSLLITAYTIIATAFWFIHNREFESAGVPPDLVLENVSSLSAGNNTLVMEDRRLWG